MKKTFYLILVFFSTMLLNAQVLPSPYSRNLNIKFADPENWNPDGKEIIDSIFLNAPYVLEGDVVPIYNHIYLEDTLISEVFRVTKVYRSQKPIYEGEIELIIPYKSIRNLGNRYTYEGIPSILFCNEFEIESVRDYSNKVAVQLAYDYYFINKHGVERLFQSYIGAHGAEQEYGIPPYYDIMDGNFKKEDLMTLLAKYNLSPQDPIPVPQLKSDEFELSEEEKAKRKADIKKREQEVLKKIEKRYNQKL